MKRIMVIVLLFLAPFVQAIDIEAKMLAKGTAVLIINGNQRLLREGSRSPEGVLLVSADNKQAVLEVDGVRKNISLSHAIGSSFKQADKIEVRLASSYGGHYRTGGLINGMPVDFLVDTGASFIAMNYLEAERLHIDYRGGRPIMVSTANGDAQAFMVTLNSVSVGNIVLHQVQAAVSTTESPTVVLLGNSYLSKVDFKIEQGVLVLREK